MVRMRSLLSNEADTCHESHHESKSDSDSDSDSDERVLFIYAPVLAVSEYCCASGKPVVSSVTKS